MHVLSRKALKEFADRHADAGPALDAWYRIAKASAWTSIQDVRATYPHADFVDGFTVFNIKGNLYRLVVVINFLGQRIFIKHIMTHAEYDRGNWK